MIMILPGVRDASCLELPGFLASALGASPASACFGGKISAGCPAEAAAGSLRASDELGTAGSALTEPVSLPVCSAICSLTIKTSSKG
jgi:hypothetical protein